MIFPDQFHLEIEDYGAFPTRSLGFPLNHLGVLDEAEFLGEADFLGENVSLSKDDLLVAKSQILFPLCRVPFEEAIDKIIKVAEEDPLQIHIQRELALDTVREYALEQDLDLSKAYLMISARFLPIREAYDNCEANPFSYANTVQMMDEAKQKRQSQKELRKHRVLKPKQTLQPSERQTRSKSGLRVASPKQKEIDIAKVETEKMKTEKALRRGRRPPFKSRVREDVCTYCGETTTSQWRRNVCFDLCVCNSCGMFATKLVSKFGLEKALVILEVKRKENSVHNRKMGELPEIEGVTI